MVEIIDAHTHIFPDRVADRAVAHLGELYAAEPVRRPVLDELIAEMDEAGVGRSVLAPVSTRPDQVPSINDFMAGLVEHPRVIPFGTLHPDREDVGGEIDRLVDAGVRGVKLQPYFQGFDFAEPGARRMFELIGDRLVVLMHGGQEIVPIENVIPNPEALARLVADFPRLRMIVAHLGSYEMWDEVQQHLVGQDVHFDLSYTFNRAPDELIRDICAGHGWHRIIFGSDFPWQSQTEALDGLRRLNLDDATFAAVASGNLLRLLGCAA
ncbi:MAG: amidohydrolase family protein [Armatimonadota bacterium]|nr:amidohydrolase family protein [Armatimonadota bacterium]